MRVEGIVIGLMFLMTACSITPSNKENEPSETLEDLAKETTINVVDTDFSKGRLTNRQVISLWDVQKLHGHLCDGLVVGFLGLREGLYRIYEDSLIDRTDIRIVTKSSPCIGDVGLYLSGGRYQFNSYYVDNSFEGVYIVQSAESNKAVVVRMKNGVKPAEIDVLGAKAIRKELNACGLDSLKALEDDFSRKLLNGNPKDFFEVEWVDDFRWTPDLRNDFVKTDVLNKNADKCNEWD